MTRRTLIGLIVLLLIVAGVVWLTRHKTKEVATPVLSVSAYNQTKNTDAASSTASDQDLIVYTLTAENQSNGVISGYVMEANISEITDKASLVDASGASYNAATNSLVWTPLDIPANNSITKQFSVRVNSLAAGSTNTVMKIKFNNEVDVSIAPKQVVAVANPGKGKPTTYKAPVTGPSASVPFVLALILTASIALFGRKLFAFARS